MLLVRKENGSAEPEEFSLSIGVTSEFSIWLKFFCVSRMNVSGSRGWLDAAGAVAPLSCACRRALILAVSDSIFE